MLTIASTTSMVLLQSWIEKQFTTILSYSRVIKRRALSITACLLLPFYPPSLPRIKFKKSRKKIILRSEKKTNQRRERLLVTHIYVYIYTYTHTHRQYVRRCLSVKLIDSLTWDLRKCFILLVLRWLLLLLLRVTAN